MKQFIIILCTLLLGACGQGEKEREKNSTSRGVPLKIKYAKGFEVTRFKDYSLLEVKDPWPGAEKSFTYLLARKEIEVPGNVSYDHKITVPVSRMVVTSTTHIPALEALGVEDKLVGFPGLDFISSRRTRGLIEEGKIKELGKNEQLNTESLIELQPEVVIAFAIDGNNKSLETIEKMNIPVVYNADWKEEDPLGKAEWIKFFGLFFDKTDEAVRNFEQIDNGYQKARETAKIAEDQPTVIGGSMYRDQWYMPSGTSWQARFFKDANANYIFGNSTGEGSLSLSFETVLEKAGEADFWVSSGQFTSYSELLDESRHYAQFKAVRQKQVYSVSLSKGATGGVLFYELGPQRPDLVLKDLVSIFHPELLPAHQQVFFKGLKE